MLNENASLNNDERSVLNVIDDYPYYGISDVLSENDSLDNAENDVFSDENNQYIYIRVYISSDDTSDDDINPREPYAVITSDTSDNEDVLVPSYNNYVTRVWTINFTRRSCVFEDEEYLISSSQEMEYFQFDE